MSYITQSDILKRLTAAELVQVADLDEDGSADSAVVERAIRDAESLVNSYIGTRVSVPLTTVPDHVKTICVSMAVYYLYLGRRSVTEDLRKQYDSDLQYLRDVAAGRVAIGDQDAAEANLVTEPQARHQQGDSRRFKRDDLDEW